MTTAAPSVLWAQRPNLVFLTIQLEDCQSPTIKVEPDSIYFRGVGGTDKKEYELTIDLYEPIKPDSPFSVRERNIEFCLKKAKEGGPYWPRLTKSKDKKHWLKVDFNKWKDEDESDDEQGGPGGPPGGGFGGFGGGDNDFEEMMRNMGGLGGGVGGGAAGDKPSMDDFGGQETDSDDDNTDLPDLE